MSDLLIRIKKKANGGAALSCLRADGSVTWQRQEGLQGRFFPLHDLTHYAVGSVLGGDQAFFGLIAQGGGMGDTGGEGRPRAVAPGGGPGGAPPGRPRCRRRGGGGVGAPGVA